MASERPELPRDRAGLLKGLHRTTRRHVLNAARPVDFAAGEAIFRQGDAAAAMFVLLRGKAKVSRLSREGERVMIRVVAPGEAFGMVPALGAEQYGESALAAVDCAALQWPAEPLTRLLETSPRLAFNMLRLLQWRLGEMLDRFEEVVQEPVERRVARTLLRVAGHAGRREKGRLVLDFPVTRRDLADLSGASMYTVSRLMSDWQQRGLVKSSRRQLSLNRPAALRALATGSAGR